jgi:branched-chain amino acid transport system permease protein
MQFLLNAASSSALVSLMGFAIWVIYRSRGYYDFGLLGALVAGPYAVIAINRLGGSSILGIGTALVCAALAGALTTLVLPTESGSRKAVVVQLTVGSYGLWLAWQGLLIVLFGDQPLPFPRLSETAFVSFGTSSISTGELLQLAGATLLWILLILLNLGNAYWTAWKATAIDPQTALHYGIPAKLMIAFGAGIAYLAATIAGITQAVSVDATPYPVFALFLNGAVVALLADGLGIAKLFVASLAIGSAVTLSVVTIGAVWQEVFSATVLFAVLASANLPARRSH